VGKLITTTHLGTHLDAPWHYLPDGERLDQIPLDTLIGSCQVIDARGRAAIDLELLQTLKTFSQRLLFYTGQPNHWAAFPSIIPVVPAAIAHMAAQGVRLFGTDCPSVDPLDSKDLLAHKAFGRSGIYILEGLALADIAPGPYELIALPLNLIGADAAPVRAILRGGRR
jgi:arylformamidase